MGSVKRVLIRIGFTLLITALGIALYSLSDLAYSSRAFVPVRTVPLLVAVFFVSVRLGIAYGLIPLLLPPLYCVLIGGVEPDPTNTSFILTVIILFQLLFLLIISRIFKAFIKNSAILTGASYVTGAVLTWVSLKYGLFPFLPLLSLPTILQNFLFGSIVYTFVGFLLFEAAGILLINMRLRIIKKTDTLPD